MSRFVDVFNPETGIKQSVPEHFLDDPILGRSLRKTPSQRALDGELGQAPTADSTIAEIKAFADEAEIDVAGLRKHDELLSAVQAVVGTDPLPEPVPAGDVDVLPGGDIELGAGVTDTGDATTSPDGNQPDDNSAAAAGQE
jgi:hypothetical protein